MHSRFDIKITLGVVVSLVAAIVILHSIVLLSIEPGSLSAAIPPGLVVSQSE
jgi:hypothetical protein